LRARSLNIFWQQNISTTIYGQSETMVSHSSQLVRSSHLSKLYAHCYIALLDVYWFFQVHRVLLYSKNGRFDPPSLKISAAFSKANWGDFTATSVRGLEINIKRATLFLKRIEGLKSKQWDDIFTTAVETVKCVGPAENDGEHGEGGLCSSDDDDDELLDPMYDELPSGS
jgi:hypothetical protein